LFEEILPGLYRIKVPLPGSPLKATNSYVIKGAERSLIIDTGWNREDCMTALVSGLKECGVDSKQADFFITHMHADHAGLVSTLAGEGARIYFGWADAEIIRSATPEHWEKQIDFARKCGFPGEELERAIGSHPGRRYSPNNSLNLCVSKDGDTISIGDYLFECIETPGHTAGHICLYEPSKKIFICGDHILVDITPNITLSSEERNPLKEYLMSLDKVYNLDVELVLPGHRSIFRNQKERIRELKQHHQTRLKEVIAILGKGKQNAFQVASQMTWDISYKSWDLFPPAQKWFAFGEALAHLKYLEEEGEVGWGMEKQGIMFFITQNKKEAH
jgi:glyoxylase-like metal-dependent hydrolase (beta-lactamase superfamily II)